MKMMELRENGINPTGAHPSLTPPPSPPPRDYWSSRSPSSPSSAHPVVQQLLTQGHCRAGGRGEGRFVIVIIDFLPLKSEIWKLASDTVLLRVKELKPVQTGPFYSPIVLIMGWSGDRKQFFFYQLSRSAVPSLFFSRTGRPYFENKTCFRHYCVSTGVLKT